MNRTATLLCSLAALAAVACHADVDNRFFAPEAAFGSAEYTVAAGSGGLDVDIVFSRPVQKPFTLGVNASGSLQEGVQYRLGATSIDVAKGATGASLHIDLIDDEIWDEASWIDLLIVPGSLYTVNPDGNCAAHITVTKEITLPLLRLVAPEGEAVINPFLGGTLHYELASKSAVRSAIKVLLEFGDLVPGSDYLVNGAAAPEVLLEAGASKAGFDIQILQKDQSGLDKHEILSIVAQKGVYVADSAASSADVHLSDPSVDFSSFFKTAAQNGGSGYQIRQAIKGPDGSWNGNTTVDMGVTAEGSNYLRNFRNMFQHPSFSCLANAGNSQMFRLSELFPNYLYPNPVTILDYGNDQGHRQFTPADSLMRFVLDRGETKKGRIYFTKQHTFVACIGSYAQWQTDIAGGKTWVVDSRANNGDILASANPAITGRISVTLHKLEGSFDFTNSDAPVLVTAWFSSDSEQFLNGIDATKFAVTKDDGLWKIEYKLWPR